MHRARLIRSHDHYVNRLLLYVNIDIYEGGREVRGRGVRRREVRGREVRRREVGGRGGEGRR